MQKAPSIYKLYPEWGGQVLDLDYAAPRKEPPGSPGAGTCSPEPAASAQQGRLCHRLSTQAAGIPGGLSLLAMTMGCRFLLRPVGWDPSLIFDFNTWVRIYFFVSVLFHLT